MNQVNYQKELEKILNTLQEKGEAASDWRPPPPFLHSCCAPWAWSGDSMMRMAT